MALPEQSNFLDNNNYNVIKTVSVAKKAVSIVVPVYNEESNILLFYNELKNVCGQLAEKYDFEFIFVNDGSNDHSGKVIEDIVRNDSRVKYLEFSRNFGKEVALTAGFQVTKGKSVIILDVDLQHPPALIPEFLKKWEDGGEVIIGVREKSINISLSRKFFSWFFYELYNLIGNTKIVPNATDYRLLDQKVVNEFNRFTEHNRMTRGLIAWLGFKREFIYFVSLERKNGRAGYSFSKLRKLAIDSLISNSLLPLRLAGYLGIFIVMISGILGAFILIDKYILDDPLNFHFSGLAIVAILNLFLVGIVLICLGLIALYIANIHGEVINRPLYVIRRKKLE